MSSNNKKRMSAAKDTKGTVKRLLGYLSAYKLRFIFVVICIAVSAATVAYSAVFIQDLIDDYITPFIGQKNPVLSELFTIIATMATAYGVTVFCSWLYRQVFHPFYV